MSDTTNNSNQDGRENMPRSFESRYKTARDAYNDYQKIFGVGDSTQTGSMSNEDAYNGMSKVANDYYNKAGILNPFTKSTNYDVASSNEIYTTINDTSVSKINNQDNFAETTGGTNTYLGDSEYLSANYDVVDQIIEILNKIKKEYISSGKDIIASQVKKINSVPGYTPAVGVLSNESVNMPLVRLEIMIDSLLRKFEAAKEEALKWETAQDSASDGDDNSSPSGYYPYGGTRVVTGPDDEVISVEIVDWEKPDDSGSYATPHGSPEKITEVPTEAPTETPTEVPTTAPATETIIEAPTETVTVPVTKPPIKPPITEAPTETPTAGPTPATPVNQPTSGNTSGGGWYRGSSTTTNPPTSASTEAPKLEEDVIKKGNTYKLPTSTKISTTNTTTQKQGNSAIPVLAGLAAAAAAGIGAKAYIDKKKNSDNEEEDFQTEDWSDNTDVNIEYQEPTSQQEETLEFDDNGPVIEEPEKYGARTHEELEDLQ